MKKHRAFLKWAGGKYSLVEDIERHLPPARKLVEPFVGAGSVFLNTDFEHYLLADINPDLINLYNILKDRPEQFIEDSKTFFTEDTNTSSFYYDARDKFNQTEDKYKRSLYFLYLNRHGFNGLCRYNKSGGFNVPFGRYVKPYFPENEMRFFAKKAKKATFVCQPYDKTLKDAMRDKNCVVYCDPPYAPLSPTASFTSYTSNGFNLQEQLKLVDFAELASKKGVSVLISNHKTKETLDWYKNASDKIFVEVNRYISSKACKRHKVDELLALYQPSQKEKLNHKNVLQRRHTNVYCQ
ncbi:TPA: Dam family site-specific DNA-(adenine-N6)-methyltransferase [Photobacterium damselae]